MSRFDKMLNPLEMLEISLKQFVIIGSCNGLLCLLDCSYTDDYRFYPLYLWNPSLKLLKKLPKPIVFTSLRHKTNWAIGFGFHPCHNDFRVLLLLCKSRNDSKSNHPRNYAYTAQVYSLTNDSWRKISLSVPCVISPDNFGLYFNGGCYWIARKYRFGADRLIISYDFVTDEFQEIMMPDNYDDGMDKIFHAVIGVLKESLALLVYGYKKDQVVPHRCCIWVMMNKCSGASATSSTATNQCWVKQFSFGLREAHEILICLGFGINGEVLMRSVGKELTSYHPQTQEFKRHSISIVDIVTFVESLALLKGKDFGGFRDDYDQVHCVGSSTSTCRPGKMKRHQTDLENNRKWNDMIKLLSNLCNNA
ncbi:F-box protein [Quillaja saponaria]|uniref:F-box protein n=1 Tax=Quillaja saponaria TaxID=32244 RepID=A0AAD7Q1Q8_QUISA|nr:F-box protein [Quillaja saponaria]